MSFSIALYSDQMDVSSYPESDYSFSSHSSMIRDFAAAPLSSTRRSSFFDLSNIQGRQSCKGTNRLSDIDTARHHNQNWNNTSHWASEGPSLLSSTRISAIPAIPIIKEDDLFTDDGVFTSKANVHSATTDDRISARRDAAFLSKRASRKSVSFYDVDEYLPVFSPESPKQQPAVDGSECTSDFSFDPSEYSGFLDTERMATVLHKQGIDVTSPDHVYVFCREGSESTQEDMEKTVINHCALEDSDDEKEDDSGKEARGNIHEQPALSSGGGSSSGTRSSEYSSCESDHYTSALDTSTHPRFRSPTAVDRISVGIESVRTDGDVPPTETEPQTDVKDAFDKLSLSEVQHRSDAFKASSGPLVNTLRKDSVDKPVADVQLEDEAEQCDLPFTPSPFVTGRTRSRLSRCSLRASRTPESLFFTSSLFDATLPTPVRTQRQTPRSQKSDDFYSSPHLPCHVQPVSGSSTVQESFQDTQSSTLGACSCDSNSQADTIILSKSTVESQTLGDTVLLEKNQDSLMDAYEKNLAEIILSMQDQGKELSEDRDFLTDDLTSTDEATTKANVKDAPDVGCLRKEDVWITEECSSQLESVSSSSSSSYFSPKRSREDSALPCTPGTGCTPRYSMSRLSCYSRPQSLANLSYTPGGRPHLQDVDEPVEYLYTDTERGHKLIEIHVPPTANTSLSSSMSTTSSEETILYDWRSMQRDIKRGKENHKPQKELQVDKSDEVEDELLQETKGITDKELRQRLVGLGESPGPISQRTRPVYMKRLCRLLLESKSRSPRHQKQRDQPKTGIDCFT